VSIASDAAEETLLALLVLMDRPRPIDIVEPADRVRRDHSTISRQAARLVEPAPLERKPDPSDRRIREAVATSAGRAMDRRIDDVRGRNGQAAMSGWTPQ